MEMSSLITIGIGLFIFWFFVGMLTGASNHTGLFLTLTEKLIICLLLVGFVWFVANLILTVLQGWWVSPDWVKYSSIFWWISFVGGILGIFVIPKKSKDSKV